MAGTDPSFRGPQFRQFGGALCKMNNTKMSCVKLEKIKTKGPYEHIAGGAWLLPRPWENKKASLAKE